MGLSDIVDAFDGELLALFLFGTYLVAGLGSAVSPPLRVIYEQPTVMPCFAPPPWLFGLVWPVLYTLGGIAAYLVRIEGGLWTSGSDGNLLALVLYGVLQLVMTLYTIVGSRRQHWAGAAVIFIALGLAVTTAVLFAEHSTTACVFISLLAGWLLFALALQIGFAYLNRAPPLNSPPQRDDWTDSD